MTMRFLCVAGLMLAATAGQAQAGIVLGTPAEVSVTGTGEVHNGGKTFSYTNVNFTDYTNLWFYLSEAAFSGDGNAFDESPSGENLTQVSAGHWSGSINVATATGTVSGLVELFATVSGSAAVVGAPVGYPTGIEPGAPAPAAWSTDTTDNFFVQSSGDFSVTLEAKVGGQTLKAWYDGIDRKLNPNHLRTELWLGTMYEPVPEPASLAMWSAMAGVAFVVRRRRKKAVAI